MKKNYFHRLNKDSILKDLKKKIVFLTGPRQVGKTWLAKKIMNHYKNPLYLNYDSFKDRKVIEEQSWLESSDLIVFDEIHKMDQFKTYIKGVFDTRPKHRSMLVTGSARLQQMNKSGDSLAGRFFSHTLLPFSFLELKMIKPHIKFSKFFNRGGFPEPLLLLKKTDDIERWRQQYMFSLLREDIPDFKFIQNYRKMKNLLYLLREQIGSPVSIHSLSKALHLDHKTVSAYIHILEDLFIIFQVPSFSKNIARSLSKSKKIYFYDFGFIDPANKGGKLENAVALHLLKHCLFLQETKPSQALGLHYLRTKEQREVDFLLTKEDSPHLMIEVKTKDTAFSHHLVYFYDRYGISGRQLSVNLKRQKQIKGKNILSEDLETFLLNLGT